MDFFRRVMRLFRAPSRKGPDPPPVPVNNTGSEKNDNDIVILVLSVTGAGKSTFINAVAGRDATEIGHDLNSCTKQIRPIPVAHPDDHERRIVFVDTPGFNDTFIHDTAIENGIDTWLATSYGGSTVAGIVYLHDISEVRMPSTALKHLIMFRKWCGNDAIRHVVFATTKWSDVPPHVGRRREQEIMENHWRMIFDEGARNIRFTRTHTEYNAWDVVNLIIHGDHQ